MKNDQALHFEIRKKYVDKGTIREMHEVFKEKFHLPLIEDVAESLSSDHIFCYLYSEMRYRRLSRPTFQDRIACWHNYNHLFKMLCGGEEIWLPEDWLWDLLDQFVNQFQSFCEFRAKQTLTEEQNEMAWSVFSTLSLLRTMVRDSSICQTLQDQKWEDDWSAYDVSKSLGYFAKVGLLRVHCFLGQYRTGLNRLQPINIFGPGFFSGLIDSHISTIYHCAFANFMLGSYDEAVRILNNFHLYFFEERYEDSRDYQQIQSKIRQMFSLLAVCYLFCSQDNLVDADVKCRLFQRYGADIRISLKYLFCSQDNLVDADVRLLQRYGADIRSSQKSSKPKSFRQLLKRAWPEFTAPFEPDSYFKSWLCRPNPDEKMFESMYPQECPPFDLDDKEPYLSHSQHDQWIDTLITTTSMSKLKLK